MRAKFFEIGGGAYVNSEEINFIIEANSAKVRRYFEKYKINRNGREVFDATSTEETKGMVFMKDGTIALSNMKATLLVKRANKDYPPESEKVAKPAKAKSTEPKEKIFVNSNPQPPKSTAQFVDENIEGYDVEDNYEENGFMSIFDE